MTEFNLLAQFNLNNHSSQLILVTVNLSLSRGNKFCPKDCKSI
ncbi:hypothetical protein H1P_1700002 [Hyella patelloides LEGE 07179]|uniref:Uncharacterized protein n=1 Tax=Hyella patelloides LEGE 07179 TaxID=945734 RepID=A0A563VNE5_9CYAN|nr:hypothetical protein H1P_1700002 [Hyella patelloides LEGE 07179]